MLALLLFACDTTITSTSQSCEVDLISLTPAQVVPGDTVTLTAVPLTEAWDTAIRVGGLEAEVLTVTREGCDDCDVCQAEQGCTGCKEDCDACDATCDTCVETATFTVPALEAGDHAVLLFNANGGSNPVTLTVTEPDTGAD